MLPTGFRSFKKQFIRFDSIRQQEWPGRDGACITRTVHTTSLRRGRPCPSDQPRTSLPAPESHHQENFPKFFTLPRGWSVLRHGPDVARIACSERTRVRSSDQPHISPPPAESRRQEKFLLVQRVATSQDRCRRTASAACTHKTRSHRISPTSARDPSSRSAQKFPQSFLSSEWAEHTATCSREGAGRLQAEHTLSALAPCSSDHPRTKPTSPRIVPPRKFFSSGVGSYCGLAVMALVNCECSTY